MSIFKGKAERLNPDDIKELSEQFNLEPAHIRTVMEVETSGKGFNSLGIPEFLFEPHIFYRIIKNNSTKLKRAVSIGVAYPSWKGPGKYPKGVNARWHQFMLAHEIDSQAAIKSASWGLGQIMGSEFDEAGYDSPEEMLEAFSNSERNQLEGMCNLIKSRELDNDLRKFPDLKACEHFALKYNGKGFRRNNYHTKLQSAYRRWTARGEAKKPMLAEDGILRIGSYGPRVEALQKTLKDKGYKIIGRVDGKFGVNTRDTVNAWKADNGFELNGEMNSVDLLTLEKGPERVPDSGREAVTKNDLRADSSIIRDSDLATKVGTVSTIGVGAAEAADKTGLLDQVSEVGDKADKVSTAWGSIKGFLDSLGITDLIGFIVHYKFYIVASLLIGAIIYFTKIQKARIKMHQDREIG